MKKSLLHRTVLLVAVLFCSSLFAQDWVKMMQDPSVNFYDVQKAFNTYYAKKEREIERENKRLARKEGTLAPEGEMEVPGFEQYKRWEHFMQPRVSSTGERFAPDAVWKAMEEYKNGYQSAGAGNWTLIGPASSTVPSNGGGAGRANFITVHPTNPTTMWTGSPGGGLWKTTNGGTSWSTNTDNLPQVIGCTDLAIDPTNPNTMYLATGDGEGGDTYSVGLLKSTDGGTTWKSTGLSFAMAAYRQISKVLIDPTNTNTIFLATSAGVYKSTDAGATFSVSLTGSFKDIEFKPGTPATVYACGNEFSYTTNGGTSWTKVTAVLPAAAACQRMAIAVSPADPTIVYALTAKVTTYDLEGLYKSTNSGVSFTKLSTTPATIIGTQGFYALSLAVSPTNASEIFVGGLDIYKSTNGGTSFSKMSDWVNSPYVHADIHELEYAGSTVYSACDGGVFKTSDGGSSWSDLSNGLQISEMYGFGQSSTNANLLLTGWQDNGTNRLSGTSWSRVIGGDGMKAFISWGNDQNMWGSIYNGQIQRSTNGGASFAPCTSGLTEATGSTQWITEWNEDPTTANTIYAGYKNVWKSTNGGASWTKLGTLSTTTINVQAIAVSPASSQNIWAAKGSEFWHTTNGGTSWTAVTSIPNGITISDIACHPTDANKAWITCSGFSAANKVLQTTDGGITWTNLSPSLPNIPINCIAVNKNGNDALYIGTDVGAYYKDATMTVWQPFSNGLPNVTITQLEIFYSGSKIRASTYGRGVWESSFYVPGAYAPDANFGADKYIGCPGLGVQFTDYTAGQPTSWNWIFPGGNPATSNKQNPFVAYNTPGTYSVSLTASNANGTDTQVYNALITVSPSANAAPAAAGKKFCGPATVNLTASPSAPGTVRWWNQPAGGSILSTGNTYSPALPPGSVTFYVDEAFPSGTVDVVGATDNTIGAGAMFSASDIRGLYFDVLQPVVINSVDVYSNSAGNRTIEIVDENGNLVTDTTVMVPASPTAATKVIINRTVYPGNNFIMKFRGLVDCYRNSAGAAFPYTSSCVNITNTNSGTPGYYYFFYNWAYTKIVCNTGRTAVYVQDTCSTIGINDVFVNNHIDVYPNPNNGQFTASFHVDNNDDYLMKVTNAIGQVVYEEKLNNFSGTYANKIDIEAYGKGVYMLSISNSRNETVKKVLVY